MKRQLIKTCDVELILSFQHTIAARLKFNLYTSYFLKLAVVIAKLVELYSQALEVVGTVAQHP